jgi:hypothetical protein
MNTEIQVVPAFHSHLDGKIVDLSLAFRVAEEGQLHYPTDRLQKGLLLYRGDKELSGEGVGFGVPILKFGFETVFAGSASVVSSESNNIVIDYAMNLVPRMTSGEEERLIKSAAFYRLKEFFSLLHREMRPFRKILARGSKISKSILGLRTRFEETNTVAVARVAYKIDPACDTVKVTADLTGLKKVNPSEVIIANELGASRFDFFRDSKGAARKGKAIGTWNETKAGSNTLADLRDGIGFTLQCVPGARLFRGREMVVGRLNWAGLNYSITEQIPDKFEYVIKIEAV